MFLDLIHKNLHISSGEAMAGDAGFDLISEASAGGESSTTALGDSTEADQFDAAE